MSASVNNLTHSHTTTQKQHPYLCNQTRKHPTTMKEDNTKRFSGSVEIANIAGVNAAIVHEKLVYYIIQNYKKKQLWQVTISADKLANKLPFLTKRQILYAIDKLQQKQLITIQNWRDNNSGTQKTYTIDGQILKLFYKINQKGILTNNRDKFVTHQDKIVTPPLQNCHTPNSNTIDIPSTTNVLLGNTIELHSDTMIYKQNKIKQINKENSIPQNYSPQDPSCTQWNHLLPSFITQQDYNTIKNFVAEFGTETTKEYLQDAKNNNPNTLNNADVLRQAEQQLILLRHEQRRIKQQHYNNTTST